MTGANFCEDCGEGVAQFGIALHLETCHTGRNSWDEVKIGCVQCEFRIGVGGIERLIQHCSLIGHSCEELRVDWGDFLAVEHRRLSSILSRGVAIHRPKLPSAPEQSRRRSINRPKNASIFEILRTKDTSSEKEKIKEVDEEKSSRSILRKRNTPPSDESSVLPFKKRKLNKESDGETEVFKKQNTEKEIEDGEIEDDVLLDLQLSDESSKENQKEEANDFDGSSNENQREDFDESSNEIQREKTIDFDEGCNQETNEGNQTETTSKENPPPDNIPIVNLIPECEIKQEEADAAVEAVVDKSSIIAYARRSVPFPPPVAYARRSVPFPRQIGQPPSSAVPTKATQPLAKKSIPRKHENLESPSPPPVSPPPGQELKKRCASLRRNVKNLRKNQQNCLNASINAHFEKHPVEIPEADPRSLTELRKGICANENTAIRFLQVVGILPLLNYEDNRPCSLKVGCKGQNMYTSMWREGVPVLRCSVCKIRGSARVGVGPTGPGFCAVMRDGKQTGRLKFGVLIALVWCWSQEMSHCFSTMSHMRKNGFPAQLQPEELEKWWKKIETACGKVGPEQWRMLHCETPFRDIMLAIGHTFPPM